jgi:hypothetical protein
MLWFHQDNQARMKRRHKARLAYTQVLHRDLSLHRLLAANIALTQHAFESADTDERIFAELSNEPMPEHLRTAVHRETDLWVALHTTLTSVRDNHVTASEYARLVPHLRQELDVLKQLLELQREALYSPLSKHFVDRIDMIAQVKP